jgi:hypothetical protein
MDQSYIYNIDYDVDDDDDDELEGLSSHFVGSVHSGVNEFRRRILSVSSPQLLDTLLISPYDSSIGSSNSTTLEEGFLIRVLMHVQW